MVIIKRIREPSAILFSKYLKGEDRWRARGHVLERWRGCVEKVWLGMAPISWRMERKGEKKNLSTSELTEKPLFKFCCVSGQNQFEDEILNTNLNEHRQPLCTQKVKGKKKNFLFCYLKATKRHS